MKSIASAAPKYDYKRNVYTMEFIDEYGNRRRSEGSLSEVLCEYLGFERQYPYMDAVSYSDVKYYSEVKYASSLEELVSIIVKNPWDISIVEDRQYYSEQDIEMLNRLAEKLIDDKDNELF